LLRSEDKRVLFAGKGLGSTYTESSQLLGLLPG
jgi:hypothetical protein